ncbi:MAG: DUF2889 domain-containing protein [Gammaproteobacteria bacterium]|nr:MAG: DUF2889 domain-containing protein [Gammaproteobacteria bacterium]
MPLSPAAPRKLLHTRTVTCHGYQRDDGLWDIEGHLVDVKTYDFDNDHRNVVKAGEPVHEMWLRLSIDDDMQIRAAEAAIDYAPYAMCPDITSRFALIEGLRIGPGFHRQLHKRVGGVKGCTHLVELLRPLATTAFQTLVAKRRKRESDPDAPPRRPLFINTCHAHASDSPEVKRRWPAFYTGPERTP